jgi:hypothetical protein
MSTSEVWMGSGLTMTMAPEAKLFLGYMPYGPTLGKADTNKEHLIKYSLGYAEDSSGVAIHNAHGEGTNAVKHFTDYYLLVPDLYTGCTAEFYTKSSSGDSYELEFTAMVAGNDADAIYFSGNLGDFPTLFVDEDAAVSASQKRGYICLQKHGAVVPAPLHPNVNSFEKRNNADTTAYSAASEFITLGERAGDTISDLSLRDRIYGDSLSFVGTLWSAHGNATIGTAQTAPSSGTTHLHFISSSLARVGNAASGQVDPSVTAGIGTMALDDGSGTAYNATGVFTAGDHISFHDSSDSPTAAGVLGIVITVSSDGSIITYAQYNTNSASNDDYIMWGRDMVLASSATDVRTAKPKILSDNWLGLVDSATPSTPDVMTEQKMMAIGGTRNVTYQYKGMETPSAPSLDVTLNHGTWLHYALGSTAVTLPTSGLGSQITTLFDYGTAPSEHKTLIALNSGATAVTSNTDGPLFHRVLKGSDAICPPLLPGTSAKEITEPTVGGDGLINDAITYTFSERNDSTLPSFAFELVAEKGSNVDSEPIVDRGTTTRQDATTFDTKDNVYAEIHPGATMGSLTLTANAESAVTANMTFNVKTIFDCPPGYVGRAYDATNNITKGSNLPRVLNNFGQNTGVATASKQEFLTPYYFSDGNITLFGNEFMRVTSFDLNIENTLTDKRFIGQHNKRIQTAQPGQRTYTINMTAQLTDRRLFAELRNEDSFRNAMSNANIQLLLTKATGENIKLQFDDYMISVASYPGPTEDRGPLEVSFTIMPIRKGTEISTKTSWVLQG